jgi:hypothetical protein
MKFKLEVNLNTDAFTQGHRNAELADVLRKAADLIGRGYFPTLQSVGPEWKLADSNGNTVGRYYLVH